MKIVYVIRSLALWGGIERIVTDKANWLAGRGHDVLVVTADQNGHALPYTLDSRVRLADLDICFHHQYRYHGMRRLYDRWRRQQLFRQRLAALIDREQPDVLVCTASHFVGDLVQVKGSTPLVVESHSLCEQLVDTGHLRLLRRWQKRRQLRKADVVVALTEGDAKVWRSYVKTVEVIPNMMHEPDSPTTSPLKERRVIFVGRLEPQKQPLHILEAWKMVMKEQPDWRLSMYGDGSMEEAVRREAAAIGPCIEVLPPTDRIFEQYAASSVLVLCSQFEPFGLVMAEAMACGVPVVAYDCHYGPRDIITHGAEGYLVEPDNTDALAQHLTKLMADDNLRRRMGEQAQVSARRFTAQRVMPLWEQLFSKVAGHQS